MRGTILNRDTPKEFKETNPAKNPVWPREVMRGFQTTIDGRFVPLATLLDEDADLDSMVAQFNKAVSDIAAEFLGKQCGKKKPWVTPEVLDRCDQIQDLKKKTGEPEGAKVYREIKIKIRTEIKMTIETGILSQCQEVEVCLRKNNSKKTYQLVRELITEKPGKSTTIQSKKISNDQELIQSDLTSCPQNQKGNN